VGERTKAQTAGAQEVVNALVDTSVAVDILRNYPPAVTWIRSQSFLGLTRAAVIELIEGARDNRSYRNVIKLIGAFELIETTVEDLIWTTEKLPTFRYSHNVDAFDCLIAATSIRLALPLYTRNLKHYAPMLGNQAITPY
jgi:predicted nucleic acid-binding protein